MMLCDENIEKCETKLYCVRGTTMTQSLSPNSPPINLWDGRQFDLIWRICGHNILSSGA